MATTNLEDRISKMKAQLKQLEERKKLADNRERQKQREQERKDETRRKIILGALLLKRMNNDAAYREQLLAWLENTLKENRDRKLFGLPELPNSQNVEHQQMEQEKQLF